MAREAGQYRKMLLEQQTNHMQHPYSGSEWHTDFSWEWFRFYVCLALFVGYVLLDYTGGSIYELNSSQILSEVQKDMTQELHLDQLLAGMLEEIEITEEPVLPASTIPGEESMAKPEGEDGESDFT